MANRGTTAGGNKGIASSGAPQKRRYNSEHQVRLWEQRFQELSAFQRKHGHCNVPSRTQLGNWVSRQKLLRRQGTLPPERYVRLKKLGLDWRNKKHDWCDDRWLVMYDKLKAYKRKYGDCLVSETFKDDMQLGSWVSSQVSHESVAFWRKPDKQKVDLN